jgi:hypothetical protein
MASQSLDGKGICGVLSAAGEPLQGIGYADVA